MPLLEEQVHQFCKKHAAEGCDDKGDEAEQEDFEGFGIEELVCLGGCSYRKAY